MKITKNKTTKLTEAEEIVEPVADVTDSTADLADGIQKAVEVDSAGEHTLNDKMADKIAEVVKKSAEQIEADDILLLDTKNALTDCLDEHLRLAKSEQRKRARGQKVAPLNNNLLVVGLPGSGKTATVISWAKNRGLNLFYLNAKNPDLEAFLNGYTVKSDTEKNTITHAFSNALDRLAEPDSVLFLDEYNRQLNAGIRGSLLTLINEKAVAGAGKDGYRHFNNILFTVALINPPVIGDEGVADLDVAEYSRFRDTKYFDSDTASALNYFDNLTESSFVDLLKVKDIQDDPDFRQDFLEIAKVHQLATLILKAEDFMFDDFDTYEQIHRGQRKSSSLNQRSFTDLVRASEGDINVFKNMVDSNSPNFPKQDIEMLSDIILEIKNKLLSDEDLIKYWVKYLKNKLNIDIDITKLLTGSEAESKNDTVANADQEDDIDLFGDNAKNAANKNTAVDDSKDILSNIDNILNAW